MRLNKTDALLVHAVLFRHACENDSDPRVEDLLADLEDFIVSSDSNDEEDDDDVDDEVEVEATESDFELPEVDEHLTPASLSDLPALNVTSPTGEKVTFEFEDVGADDSVDVLVDEGTVILDNVLRVKVLADQIELFDSEEKHVFGVKKLPKTWAKVLKVGVVYGLDASQEEEE